MNATYDNRTYYAIEISTFKRIMSDIVDLGNHVNGTREFANIRIVIDNAWLAFSNMDTYERMEVEGLLQAIHSNDENYITDTYDSKHYTLLKSELEEAQLKFQKDCVATRRAVLSFPSSHCFESIQFLIRDGEVIITVNMRSCNAYKNLIKDLYLAYRLACDATLPYTKGKKSLIANIGSLHIFKEDLPNVLRNA